MRLADLSILAVWEALGGGPLRHGRGRRFWSGSKDYNVSLDTRRNVFYDFVSGTGGGATRLVQVALNVDKARALRWLEDNCGLDPLQRPSEEDLRRRRREYAEVENRARVLAAVRRYIEQALMDAERLAVRAYHVTLARITSGEFTGQPLAELMAEADVQESAMAWFEDTRDAIRRATWDQWIEACAVLGVSL